MRGITIVPVLLGMLLHQTCFATDIATDSQTMKKGLLLRLAEAAKNIHRWTIVYEAVSTTGTGPSVHKIMSVSDSGDYYHLMAHFSDAISWNVDPFAQEIFIHSGKLIHRWPFNQAYSEADIKPGDFMPGTTWMDVLLPVLSVWPLKEYPMPTNSIIGVPVLLSDILATDGCRLMSDRMTIAGEQCCVFDYRGLERFWLSTNAFICPMRYEQFDTTSKQLIMRLNVDELNKAVANFVVPKTYRLQYFSRGQRLTPRETKVTILRCEINEHVPDSTFVAAIPAGSIRFDNHQSFSQISPGGEDLLARTAAFITSYHGFPQKRGVDIRRYLYVLAGFISGMGVTILASQSKAQRQSKTSHPNLS